MNSNDIAFTREDLYDLRLACTWAGMYWEEQEKNEDLHGARLVRESYRVLWDRVNEVIKAQESSSLSNA